MISRCKAQSCGHCRAENHTTEDHEFAWAYAKTTGLRWVLPSLSRLNALPAVLTEKNHQDSGSLSLVADASNDGTITDNNLVESDQDSTNSSLAFDSPGRYLPIDLDSCEIRLMDLYAGDWNSDLVCSLRVVSLASSPRYQALSYTWGKEESSKKVHTDCNLVLSCQANLYTALTNLRSRRKVLTLWVDAVCIDQKNANEVTHQVGVMDGIYASATSILVWLGEPEEKAEGNLAIETALQNSKPRWMERQRVIQEFVLARKCMPVSERPGWTSILPPCSSFRAWYLAQGCLA
jgi:hypothetical protein